MQVQSLGGENPLEEVMATHSVFLPGEFHGQESLVCYSPQGCKELDTTQVTQHDDQKYLNNQDWDFDGGPSG